MSNGHKVDYGFFTKKLWREWAWKQARKRVIANGVNPKDAIVLFLPGEKCLDVPIAKKNKFQFHNMFAVERDRVTIKNLRKKGINVISADFAEVLQNWVGPPLIDVIMADYCCGLTRLTANLTGALYASPTTKKGTVAIVNLLRGHDPLISAWRKVITDDSKYLDYGMSADISKKNRTAFIKEKHRGRMFYSLYMSGWVTQFIEENNLSGKDGPAILKFYFGMSFLSLPKFKSYKSKHGNTMMDSVAFSLPFGGREIHAGLKDKDKRVLARKLSEQVMNGSCQSKIAAAKAIRTMRINKRKAS